MKAVLDKYEQEIEDALDKGEFVSVPNLEATRQMFQEAAKNFRQLQETNSVNSAEQNSHSLLPTRKL